MTTNHITEGEHLILINSQVPSDPCSNHELTIIQNPRIPSGNEEGETLLKSINDGTGAVLVKISI